MQLQNRSIERALIIDDDEESSQSFEYAIEEIGLIPCRVSGPLQGVSSFIETVQPHDVLVCDFHLKKHDYANYDGDQLLVECYKNGIPGALCTTFTDATPRRDRLRYIPGLIKSGSPAPDELISSWDRCLRELNGEFEPSRRAWRTLVRIDEIDSDGGLAYVIVPPWDVRKKVRVDVDSMPQAVQKLIEPDRRFHAFVNTGAEHHEDLFFDHWETE